MKIHVPFKNHIIPDAYAKKASETNKGYAVKSFPFEIVDIPENAKTLAWTLVDYDSIPVCGFAYIHWTVANVPTDVTVISEDFARQDQKHLKGKNSMVSKFLTTDYSDMYDGYLGPYPPDKDHHYTLTVYALDDDLSLNAGFYLNELLHAIEGHVIAQAQMDLVGRA
ncbi:YbhB/YbcL family Raf kinase inhibitor-like protein [Streptococcus mutans]|uniref:YbhB/YbcL family Raf kinase inhibitor-like protein n=1 Tax=Streptococcus mutans TaxID=1309 RepID=UPI0002B50115|nr:YbhB/YbcL family Raf kinase inhibitor-like protein [Streptococcus mutans]EMB64624.1 hypothetical protein SMU22_05447 [Streptococcus mutans 4SM1]